MINPDDPLVRWGAFGRQVEMFLESDVGDMLVKRAKEQIDEALRTLKEVDPYDSRAVQKAQNKVKVAESIIEWLGEAIASGHQAVEEIKHAQS